MWKIDLKSRKRDKNLVENKCLTTSSVLDDSSNIQNSPGNYSDGTDIVDRTNG